MRPLSVIRAFLWNLFRQLAILILVVTFTACGNQAESEPSSSVASEQQNTSADILIEHVSTIDAANGLREDMTVVLRGAQIVGIGPSDQLDSSNASNYIDGTGKYLIPGLWDAHIHLTFRPELTSSMFRLLIANGITSVRDTGGKLDLMLEQRQRARDLLPDGLAPSVYIAGPLIDGTPGVYVGEVDGFPEIAVTASTVEEVKREVDRLAEADVDFLKAYEMLSPEVFATLLDQAQKHNLPVTGHIPLSMTALEASAAGLSSMEHTRNMEMACSSEQELLLEERRALLAAGQENPGSRLRSSIHGTQHHRAIETYDPVLCRSVIQELATNNTWQVPTHALMQIFKTPFVVNEDWIATFEFLPEPVRSSWRESIASYKERLKTPSEVRGKLADIAEWKNTLVRQMLEANIRFMAGTDAPIFYLTPGFSLHKELEILVAAGMSPMQALESATLAPAEYFGLEESQGLIAPGMLADLVLLKANPLDDIRNTTEIDVVFKNGIPHDREALDGLLKSPGDVEL